MSDDAGKVSIPDKVKENEDLWAAVDTISSLCGNNAYKSRDIHMLGRYIEQLSRLYDKLYANSPSAEYLFDE